MIPFENIDERLAKIGKDRAWLAEATPYSADYIRTVMAPRSTRRTARVNRVLSDAIQREEDRQAAAKAEAMAPESLGYSSIFLTDEQIERADAASRRIQSPSLAEFCREAILHRAGEIIAGRIDPVPLPSPGLNVLPPAQSKPRRAK